MDFISFEDFMKHPEVLKIKNKRWHTLPNGTTIKLLNLREFITIYNVIDKTNYSAKYKKYHPRFYDLNRIVNEILQYKYKHGFDKELYQARRHLKNNKEIKKARKINKPCNNYYEYIFVDKNKNK